jgi:hypothetical protein
MTCLTGPAVIRLRWPNPKKSFYSVVIADFNWTTSLLAEVDRVATSSFSLATLTTNADRFASGDGLLAS